MSRIDKAVQAWEASTRLNRGQHDTHGASERTSLLDYAHEAAPSPQPPVPLKRQSAAPARAPASATADLRADADVIEARLVTSGSSPLALEQYRRLAAALHDAQAESGLNTVMLTSAVPHEGKTLTTINLALTLSESYRRRVLVVDAELRCPSVHRLLGVGNAQGLTDALADEHLELPFLQVTEGLSVITAGGKMGTPLAGLSSPRMRALLDECGRRFDWVLVDTPPVGVLPDAELVARLTGGVIFVIGAGSTPAAVVERAIGDLGAECIIGAVLNGVETRAISGAAHYGHYYGVDA